METELLQAVTHYVEDVMGNEGFRYVSTVVANCKMLALELEAREKDLSFLDQDALIIAAYFHDISTTKDRVHNHHFKSAETAVQFLREYNMPEERISRVERIILAHTLATSSDQRKSYPLESRVLYDADKLGRLSGLAVITSLIEFGARYPNRSVTSEVLAAILRHIEERFVELYQSLNTEPARDMAREKFGRTLAFLDGVIEHLGDATPV
jgi:putative nucleotidyltransferase with HDIG domain